MSKRPTNIPSNDIMLAIHCIDNAPTVSFIISPDYVTELQHHNKELIKQLEEAERLKGECEKCKFNHSEICDTCSRKYSDNYAEMKGGTE